VPLETIQKIQQLVREAESRGIAISEVVLECEMENSGKSRGELLQKMSRNWSVMKQSIEKGLREPGTPMGGLVKGTASTMEAAVNSSLIPKDRISKTVMRALAVSEVNASMGLVVAAPTAGSCGILPAVLATAQEEKGYRDEDIVSSLFTAAGVGMVIARNASVAGAEGGCQAECGSAAAMAAASLVELAGGAPAQVGEAVALSLKNVLGLTCDPVAGLVEVPCIKRNAFLAVNAWIASDMAVAGIKSIIPVDEVIDTMGEVGREMPVKFKETSRGGLATTPTGERIRNVLNGSNYKI